MVSGDRAGLRCRWWRAQQAPALGELLLAIAVGEEAVVPNAVEAGREHVEQHAPDELGRRFGVDAPDTILYGFFIGGLSSLLNTPDCCHSRAGVATDFPLRLGHPLPFPGGLL